MSTRKCVFSTEFVREEIDPRVQTQWQEAYGKGAPFGKLRQMWKEVHCSKVDPYNTGCPYSISDCGLSFLVAVERTVGAHPERPTGYFRTVALTLGLDRADNKPLARDTLRRTDVHKEGDSGGLRGSHTSRPGRDGEATHGLASAQDSRTGGSPDEGAPDLHRTSHRPHTVGDVLGTLNLRPHQIPTTDSQEGDK